jgi:hypothetical protein
VDGAHAGSGARARRGGRLGRRGAVRLRRSARTENRSLLEVSSGIGLAFLISARDVSRTHLLVPYRADMSGV